MDPVECKTIHEGAQGNQDICRMVLTRLKYYVYERVNLKFRNGALESWTETKKIHPDPLAEAIKAVDEAIKA